MATKATTATAKAARKPVERNELCSRSAEKGAMRKGGKPLAPEESSREIGLPRVLSSAPQRKRPGRCDALSAYFDKDYSPINR
ncbi:hypothetical protein KM043_001808 [Ampulex compressa]|nr:hypothetical protein KM043_001808 [Ampulex compressa]